MTMLVIKAITISGTNTTMFLNTRGTIVKIKLYKSRLKKIKI